MKHVVFERQFSSDCPWGHLRVARFWVIERHVWSPVQVITADELLASGQAYLWPDRATAEAAKFVPPEPIIEIGADGWIAVADRLPAKWQCCLVTNGAVRLCRSMGAEGEWLDFDHWEHPRLASENITHWQPLPDLP